jgi:hypothetical protein
MKRLLISFSGGETSALMTILALKKLAPRYDEIRTVFANTGEENEQTLEFVHRCDEAFGFKTAWIEAVTPPERGVGARCREVTFETASRDGEPFEEMIQKHGIPGPGRPFCSKELKARPITRWARENGWLPGSYDLAIGIRADEIDRMSPDAPRRRIIYPLVKMFPHTKPMVNQFWDDQPFRLGLKGYQGNCKWCWKKSLRKHLTIISESPSSYDFPERMELAYPLTGAGSTGEPKRFFRGNLTVSDLRQMARQDFVPADDDARIDQRDMLYDIELDTGGGCEESCEVSFEDLDDESNWNEMGASA